MLELIYMFYLLDSDIKISLKDTECLATNLYHEARGETLEGQIAIGNVVLNRVKDVRYPNTVCDVVYDRKQFSWYWDGKSDEPKNKDVFLQMSVLSIQILAERFEDNTNGATHYFNPYKVNPRWASLYTHQVTYDNHAFYERNND